MMYAPDARASSTIAGLTIPFGLISFVIVSPSCY